MTQQFGFTLTGTAVTVLPASLNRQYLQIQNYVASAGKVYIAFGFTATAGTLGELELSPGGIFIIGLTPPNVVSPDVFYRQSAPPTTYMSLINGGGNASGSVWVNQ